MEARHSGVLVARMHWPCIAPPLPRRKHMSRQRAASRPLLACGVFTGAITAASRAPHQPDSQPHKAPPSRHAHRASCELHCPAQTAAPSRLQGLQPLRRRAHRGRRPNRGGMSLHEARMHLQVAWQPHPWSRWRPAPPPLPPPAPSPPLLFCASPLAEHTHQEQQPWPRHTSVWLRSIRPAASWPSSPLSRTGRRRSCASASLAPAASSPGARLQRQDALTGR